MNRSLVLSLVTACVLSACGQATQSSVQDIRRSPTPTPVTHLAVTKQNQLQECVAEANKVPGVVVVDVLQNVTVMFLNVRDAAALKAVSSLSCIVAVEENREVDVRL